MSKNVGAIEAGAGAAAACRTAFGQALSTYVGKQFEAVCLQWVIRENARGRLPFLASSFGHWWGTDPRKKAETDIDVAAADKESKSILLGECKWRNDFNEAAAIQALEYRAPLIKGYENRNYILFTKEEPSKATSEKASSRSDLSIVVARDMFV